MKHMSLNYKKCHGEIRKFNSMSLLIAAVLLAALPASVSAQIVKLPPRILAAPGEPSPTISCAASADLTGHMICGEIVNDMLYGVSWHTPPGGQGEVDELPPVPALGGSSISCASAVGQNGDPSGTVICAMASGSTLYGYAFSPEHHTSSELVSLGSAPASFSTAPSCASVFLTANGPVICAIAAESKLYGIQFDPRPGPDFFNSGLQEALPGEKLAFGGAGPSCASITIQGAAECGVTLTGGGLAAVAFDLKNIHKVINLGRPPDSNGISNISCTEPNPPSTNLSCAVIGKRDERGESNLSIITSDPQMTSPSFVSTGFKPIPGVKRGRSVSCVGSLDASLPDDVSCAVEIQKRVSDFSIFPLPPFLSVIKGLKFNSSTLSTSGFQETVFSHFNMTALSCISLFIDKNQISCGIATARGSFGVNVTFAQGME